MMVMMIQKQWNLEKPFTLMLWNLHTWFLHCLHMRAFLEAPFCAAQKCVQCAIVT